MTFWKKALNVATAGQYGLYGGGGGTTGGSVDYAKYAGRSGMSPMEIARARGVSPQEAMAYARKHGIDLSETGQTVNQGPAAVQAKIDEFESLALMYHKAGSVDKAAQYANELYKLYEGDPDQYEGRMEYIKQAAFKGFEPLGFGEGGWQVNQTKQFVDAEGTSTEQQPEDYEGPEYQETEDWREMQMPKQWQQDLAEQGGDVALELMAMQNAMQGRSAAVDMLEGWDAEVASSLADPVISPEDEQRMLAESSGTLAKGYENQRLGATHQMGMRGIDPRSGVNQELMAGMRFNALSQQASNELGTKLQNKQVNRSALERAMGLRTGVRGGIADLIAGQPLAATSMAAGAAGIIGAQRGLEMGQMSPGQGALQGGLAGVGAGAAIAPPWGAIVGGLGGAAAGYFSNK